MRTIFSAFTGVLVSVALWSPATAASDPVHYLDPAAFHALGVIDQVTNFDTFPEAVPTFLSNPYVEGDLFITSTGNIVIGKGMPPYFPVRNSITNNNVGEISAIFTSQEHNMFSVRIGRITGNGGAFLDIFTNDGLFTSEYVVFPANEGFKFHGFTAPGSDYFTAVNVRGTDGMTAIGVAEFELGHLARGSGAVPEPSAWALLILGFGGVGSALRAVRRRSAGFVAI